MVRGNSRRPALRRGAVALGLALALWCGSPAVAQSVTIPPATITATTPVSQTDQNTIRQYVAQWSPGLSSEDPSEIATSRTRLLAPLETDGIGVPFRLAYGNEVSAAVEPLLRENDELIVINALRILGEVATDRSVNSIETILAANPAANPGGNGANPSADVRTLPGVRYTAIYALVRTFEAVAGESPAVSPERIRAMIDRLGQIVRTDEDPWILDVGVRALLAAGTIEKQNFESIRAAAYTQVGDAVSERVRSLDDTVPGEDRLYFAVRAAVAMRDALTDRRSLPAAAAKAGAAMSGDMMAFAQARIEAGVDHPTEERRLLAQIVTASQASMFFAARAINPASNPPTPPSLGPLINPSDPNQRPQDAEFRRQAPTEVRKLETSPFDFPSGRFARP